MEENYFQYIPEKLTEKQVGEISAFLRSKRRSDFGDDFNTGAIIYRQTNKREARKYRQCIPLKRGDLAAIIKCSECKQEAVARYIPGGGCNGWASPSGLEMVAGKEIPDSTLTVCPLCGKKVIIHSFGSMRAGKMTSCFCVVPFVVKKKLVFMQYRVRRLIDREGQTTVDAQPFEAYIADGKKVVRMVHWRRYIYGFYDLGRWEQAKRFFDNLGVPYFYNKWPSLRGTELENAKLPEYYRATYHKDLFMPVQYVALYLKHPNVENLVTSGASVLLGQAIKEELRGSRGNVATKLRWINWKENRPAQMLNLTKEELRQVIAAGWGIEQLKFWGEWKKKLHFPEAVELLEIADVRDAYEIMQMGLPVLKTAHYLKKQGARFYYLRDYWNMERALHGNNGGFEQWPKNIQEAHNRAVVAQTFEKNNALRAGFVAMSERAAGLAWQLDGITIRPAAQPEELVEEGKQLRHCVGGYAKTHSEGKIILFIRRAEEPAKSWYTLQVDLANKTVLQLHGYKNDADTPIPPEVRAFVEAWKERVLEPWKEPKQRKKTEPKTKTNPAGDAGRAA